MSSVNEFNINLKILNKALVKVKPYYDKHGNKSTPNQTTLDAIIQLQALAIYVEKGSVNQPNIPPKENGFDKQVWKALKEIESKSTATDIAQSHFNELFKTHQNDILKLANLTTEEK